MIKLQKEKAGQDGESDTCTQHAGSLIRWRRSRDLRPLRAACSTVGLLTASPSEHRDRPTPPFGRSGCIHRLGREPRQDGADQHRQAAACGERVWAHHRHQSTHRRDGHGPFGLYRLQRIRRHDEVRPVSSARKSAVSAPRCCGGGGRGTTLRPGSAGAMREVCIPLEFSAWARAVSKFIYTPRGKRTTPAGRAEREPPARTQPAEDGEPAEPRAARPPGRGARARSDTVSARPSQTRPPRP